MGDIDPFTPAVELAAAIKRKEVSPVELAELYLGRIDELDPQLNAFCHRDDDRVRAAAKKAADDVVAAGDPATELPPFHGVPLPIKDLNDVAGWPTTNGSRGASAKPKDHSDPLVDRFVAAGFVLLGKTAAPEFGTISFTESDALGITRNPWNTDHTPGGSSGGASASVASGMAPIAHGNDGGGSIRIPSSCCGLVGLKSTRGLTPNVKVELEGMVVEGVLARTVADAAAGLDVVAVHDPAAWFSPPPRARSYADAATEAPPPGLRVAVMHDAPADLVPVDPACVAAVDTLVAALADAGHHIADELPDLPSPDELVDAFGALWNTGSAYSDIDDWDAIEPLNKALRDAGRGLDSIAFTEAVVRTQKLSRRIVESLVAGFDLMVTPTMACLPPPVGSWKVGMDENPMMGMFNCFPMGLFTSIFNVTGLPAISLPIAVDEATNLPVGVQVVAAPWREDLLLQLAASLEPRFGWDQRRPRVL